jgi:hypothetical protein
VRVWSSRVGPERRTPLPPTLQSHPTSPSLFILPSFSPSLLSTVPRVRAVGSASESRTNAQPNTLHLSICPFRRMYSPGRQASCLPPSPLPLLCGSGRLHGCGLPARCAVSPSRTFTPRYTVSLRMDALLPWICKLGYTLRLPPRPRRRAQAPIYSSRRGDRATVQTNRYKRYERYEPAYCLFSHEASSNEFSGSIQRLNVAMQLLQLLHCTRRTRRTPPGTWPRPVPPRPQSQNPSRKEAIRRTGAARQVKSTSTLNGIQIRNPIPIRCCVEAAFPADLAASVALLLSPLATVSPRLYEIENRRKTSRAGAWNVTTRYVPVHTAVRRRAKEAVTSVHPTLSFCACTALSVFFPLVAFMRVLQIRSHPLEGGWYDSQ